jgi:hypothetical protein
MEHIGGKSLLGRLAAVAIGVKSWSGPMNDQQQPHPHLVIVGGGFGGSSAVRVLADEPFEVTAIDRRRFVVALNWAQGYITFQRASRLVTGLYARQENTRPMPRNAPRSTAS